MTMMPLFHATTMLLPCHDDDAMFCIIGDLLVFGHDKHAPGAAQASIGPETKRLLGLPWPFQDRDGNE
jgi:hypothetical protein